MRLIIGYHINGGGMVEMKDFPTKEAAIAWIKSEFPEYDTEEVEEQTNDDFETYGYETLW